jgi:predicted nucleic acid-binding protein
MTSALPVTWLHRIEVLNAFQLYAFVTKSGGGAVRVTSEQAAAARADFDDDLRRSTFVRTEHIDIGSMENQFEELTLRHSFKHGFRTYDILHVSIALLLKCDTFWTFDMKAAKLAALEGLHVL